ncbi:MAG: acyl carrier protein [Moorea sp. SIO3H5]|nr:acyl carrier protein [Moorena sp. SIO3H5]
MAHVRHQVGRVLGISDSHSIGLEQGFFDLGMDSLMAVEFRGCLQKSLGISVSSNVIFNYPKIEAIVTYLIQNHLESYFQKIDEIKVDEIKHINNLAEQLENMSQEKIVELLAEELDFKN